MRPTDPYATDDRYEHGDLYEDTSYDAYTREASEDRWNNPPEPDHDYDPIAERLDFEQAMRDLGCLDHA